MLYPGLVSVTFRTLGPQQIISLVKESGLSGIEWGGDIHVPHGDLKTAEDVGRLTRDAGLSVVCYGSYYRVGHSDKLSFKTVVETALALGAPCIRVWAGVQGSDAADTLYREMVRNDLQECVQLARLSGVQVAVEFHGNTLADTAESTRKLMENCGDNAPKSLWQPPLGSVYKENLRDIGTISDFFAHSHVFAWETTTNNSIKRVPLREHRVQWQGYFGAMNKIDGDHYALLEFVVEDSPEQFLQDAACLRQLLSQY